MADEEMNRGRMKHRGDGEINKGKTTTAMAKEYRKREWEEDKKEGERGANKTVERGKMRE